MPYSRAKLKNKVDSAAPCFRQQRIGKASERNWPTQTLLSFVETHLINLTNFLGIPNSIRMLHKASVLTESYAFLKSINK